MAFDITADWLEEQIKHESSDAHRGELSRILSDIEAGIPYHLGCAYPNSAIHRVGAYPWPCYRWSRNGS